MDKNLYILPTSWDWRKFGDILHVERGGSPRPIDDYITTASDGINWIKIGDTKNSTKYIYETAEKIKPEGLKKSRLVVEGDFILSNSMSFGKPYIMKTTGCIHDGWLLLRPKNENLDKEFLYYVLGSSFVYEQFKNKASGTTVKNLNSSLVKDVDIPLPPLEEQRRIVGKLDGLFAKIDKSIALLDVNIASTNALMPSSLNGVFEELGEKWKKYTLKDAVSLLGDGLHGTPMYDDSGEYYFINGANLVNGIITIKDSTKKVSIAEYQKYKKDLNDRTVLVSINGTLGNVALYNGEKCILGKSACYFNLKDNVDKVFMTYVIQNNDFQKFIRENATGSTISNVSLKTMREYKFPLPPLNIQAQTVAYLDALHEKVGALKKVQVSKKEKLLALKASLLESAFKGAL